MRFIPKVLPRRNLVDAVFDPGQNQSPGALGLGAMEVIEAACLSARTSENVCIRRCLVSSELGVSRQASVATV
jgi:hypothetical protein